MTITIEQSQDSSRREYNTLECDVPENLDGNVTAMISEAVKRIIASQTSLATQKGNKLDKAIEQITKQVVAAYSDQESDQEDRYATPPSRIHHTQRQPAHVAHSTVVAYQSRPMHIVQGTVVPDFRLPDTSNKYPSRSSISGFRDESDLPPPPPRSPGGGSNRPGAYLSRVINKTRDPELTNLFSEDKEKERGYFYVTGTGPSVNGNKTLVDDVVMKVQAAGHNRQPSIEVILSESESDMETPVMSRKQYPNLKDIKEEKPDVPPLSPSPPKPKPRKTKPERPKLPESMRNKPERPKLQESMKLDLNQSPGNTDKPYYVPKESWKVCSGCDDDSNEKRMKSPSVSSPVTTTRVTSPVITPRGTTTITSPTGETTTIKGILKSPRPTSFIENGSAFPTETMEKSKSSSDIPKVLSPTLATRPEVPKKPYRSVLQTPVQNIKTPYDVKKQFESPSPRLSHENTDKTKKDFLVEKELHVQATRNAPKEKSDIPVAFPYGKPTKIDIEFEKKQREWKAQRSLSPSPRSSLVMVDIDIDGSKLDKKKPARSRSVEDLKKKLNKIKLKAPSGIPGDKDWERAEKKLDDSRELLIARSEGYRSRGDSFSSDNSNSMYYSTEGIKRSKSLGTLAGQFFNDRKSYTSLIETDLDTGLSTHIPLVQETDIDEMIAKSKSMTNLHIATNFKEFAMDNEEANKQNRSTEVLSGQSSNSSYKSAYEMLPENGMNDHRSRSAHELRITESLNRLSLPDWYKAHDPQQRPISLVHTKPRLPYEIGSENDYKQRRDRSLSPNQDILPSKPIILSQRVSRTISRSPTSSTCSTPVSGPPSFELPSAKFRQRSPSPLQTVKTPEPAPPLPPRDYPKRETPARDAYLRMKASTDPDTWEPLSSRSSRSHSPQVPASPNYVSSFNFDSLKKNRSEPESSSMQSSIHFGYPYDTSSALSIPHSMQNDQYKHTPEHAERVTMHETFGQPGRYVTEKYISIGQSDSNRSSTVSDGPSPSGTNQMPNYKTEWSSDSGVASMDYHQKRLSSAYTPGQTVTDLVEDLQIDTDQNVQPRDSGIDTGSPDGAYVKMLNTLDNEQKEIKDIADEITSPYNPGTKSILRDKGDKQADNRSNRSSFPVLSLSSSPGMKRRSFRSSESLRSLKEPEANTVTVALTETDFGKDKEKDQSRHSTLNSSRGSHTLEEVLDGLLAIPPPPGNPDDEEDEEDFEDFGQVDTKRFDEDTPRGRNFHILRQAETPRNSMASVKAKSIESLNKMQAELDGDDEDEVDGGEYNPPTSDVEVDEDEIIVQCRNTKCGKKTSLSQARKSYKSCHNCFTYYCGRECRKEHWERHKRKCLFSRINSGCKHVIKKVQNSESISEELSTIARTGYLSKGRGCVMLVFQTPEQADLFLMKGLSVLTTEPNYASVKEVHESEVFGSQEEELVNMCKTYNPELKYVLEVAVVTTGEVQTWPIPRRDGMTIKKCAKVRLHTAVTASKQNKREEPDTTLILTAVPGSEFTENMEERKAREICFINIQRKLRQRGVSLRHNYPDTYKKLCAYVADNEHFTPITLYPVDATTGKRFMCLIMPNSEPEADWMYNPALLDDLGLHTSV